MNRLFILIPLFTMACGGSIDVTDAGPVENDAAPTTDASPMFDAAPEAATDAMPDVHDAGTDACLPAMQQCPPSVCVSVTTGIAYSCTDQPWTWGGSNNDALSCTQNAFCPPGDHCTLWDGTLGVCK